MISINFNNNIKKVEIKFNGENFLEIVDLLKELHLEFRPETKSWLILPRAFEDKEVLKQLSLLGEVIVSDSTLKYIKEAKTSTEIIRQRIRYTPDIVSFTPLKGLEPNENYQLDDIKRFLTVNRGSIFWEQRLGKMVWLVVHMSNLFYSNKIDKALILTPSSGVYNTRREILKFSNIFKEEDIVIADKNNREPFSEEAKIVISTYRTFLLISDHYYKKTNKKPSKNYRKAVIPFDSWGNSRVIYADESQELGNPKSRQSKVIHSHKKFFNYRYILSGTPTASVLKLYSQMRFLDENIIPYSYQDFISIIGDVGNKYSKYALNYLCPDKVDKFLKSIDPYVSRRLLKDHLKITPNYIKKIYVALNKKQKFIYESLTKTVIEDVKNANDGRMSLKQVSTKFPYISLALHDPKVLEKSFENKEVYNFSLLSAIKNWKFENHSKLEALDDLVEKTFEIEEKLIIWGGHPSTLNAIMDRYSKYNPIVVHGEVKEKGLTTEEIKANAVDNFSKNKYNKLLILNFQSLSTQVNLTVCNTQIFFDRSYDLIPWLQAQKRIQGAMQDKETTTYVIIAENTIEEMQDIILENKSSLNEFAFNRDVLSREEWKKILNGKGDI